MTSFGHCTQVSQVITFSFSRAKSDPITQQTAFYNTSMVKELNYATLSNVIESWEALRRTKDYETVAGTQLFKYLFTKAPNTKPLFGFQIDADPESDELFKSKRFNMHAAYMIQMLDTSVNMLGPDIELLTEIMMELGEKHVRYGVKPEMFPAMGEALLFTLQKQLGDQFTTAMEDSWKETYNTLTQDMIRAQAKMIKRKSSSK